MGRIYIPRPTFLQKLWYLTLIHLLSILYHTVEFLLPYTPKRRLIGHPTIIRHYPPLPSLPVYLYLPSPVPFTTSTKASPYQVLRPPQGQPQRYPLYIDIHGGGFIYGSPFKDSGYCARLSRTQNCIVAAIGYRKAPRHQYPTQLEDVASLIRCVLLDPAVAGCVDMSKVVVGGFSAGAVLALQIPRMVKEVEWQAVMAWYPPVDYSVDGAGDGYAAEGRGESKGKGWLLRKCIPAFTWAVVPEGWRCDDPTLSAIYADPMMWRRLMIVCGTEDVLWSGCERFMDRMVVARGGGMEEREEGVGWRARWCDGGKVVEMAAVGERHSFTHRRGEVEDVRTVVEKVEKWLRDVWDGKVE